MRYKVEFAPADLLCPKRLLWIPFKRIKASLDEQGRVLSDVPNALAGLGAEALPRHKQRFAQEHQVVSFITSHWLFTGKQGSSANEAVHHVHFHRLRAIMRCTHACLQQECSHFFLAQPQADT